MQRVYRSQPIVLANATVTFTCTIDKRADGIKVATFTEQWDPQQPQTLPESFHRDFRSFADQIVHHVGEGVTVYVFPGGGDLL